MVPVTPEALIATADRCVKCGLCLPHCPTYNLYRDEAESPRGRISLVQGLMTGGLEAEPALLRHLDNCLLCRNCEQACPSQVEYAKLIDGARSYLGAGRTPGLVLSVLSNSALLARLVPLGAWAEKMGAARILPRKYARMAGLATSARATVPAVPLRTGARHGRIALFGGCVSSVTDRRVLAAARRLLAFLGYQVEEPEGAICCGAMHQHAGFPAAAGERLSRSVRALSALQADAVLTVASGCGAQLVEHAGLEVPVHDVSAFLAEVAWPDEMLGALRGQAVLLHQPCSLRNVMREDAAVSKLLAGFDGLEIKSLGETGCCGAAGMHLVNHPDMASRLAAPLVEQIRESGIDTVLTSNTGCGLHLSAELEAAGVPVKVRHPVEWLIDQLGAVMEKLS